MDYTIIFVIILIFTLVIVNERFNKKKKTDKEEETSKSLYHYKAKDYSMSRAEHEFFDILIASIGNLYFVFPQVHLATILDHKIVGQNWKGAFRHKYDF